MIISAATPQPEAWPLLPTMDAKRIALWCLIFAASFNGRAKANITTVPEYFSEIEGDLSKVTWAHAVNSRGLLEEAMEGDAMMLEADIVLGTLTQSPGDLLPIMGHPPKNTSDISLAQFLASVEEGLRSGSKRKGVKLDFKTTEVFKASLPVLGEYKDKIDFPLWLNADILQGPVESEKTPVDADAFLYACRTIFPDTTLSVGWTTLYGSDEGSRSSQRPPQYTSRHVRDMLDALRRNSVTQTLTFPVRAGIAAHSVDVLSYLLQTNGSTLTIWSAAGDPVDAVRLRSVIETLGRDRVYVDVPESLKERLSGGTSPLFRHVPLLVILLFMSLLFLR